MCCIYYIICNINVLMYIYRKKKLISPDELELPWRPLYKMILRIMKAKETRPEMCHICNFYETATESLIIYAKVYFPVSEYFS